MDETYHFTGKHISEYDRTKAEAHRIAEQFISQGLPLVIVISALTEDKDNLFVVISARELTRKTNPGLKIVAKAIDIHTSEKLRRAGADTVVT